jgi:excisionase family DNA binding protein
MTQPPSTVIPFAIYTVDEAAAVLRVGGDRIRDLVASGDLRPLSHTAKYRFWGEDLIAFCRSMGTAEGQADAVRLNPPDDVAAAKAAQR